MKKITVIIACICAALCLLSGCAKKVDYLTYVSEKRTDIYLYSNDGLEIKIYRSEQETPYSADGVKGEMSALTEIFVTLPENCDEVNVKAGNIEGEMNYRAVENCYYLSSSGGEIPNSNVEVNLSYGGNNQTFTAISVLYDGVISCDEAVKCVVEHNADLFASLTQNNVFCGEIYVRLLYDDGGYYYVGVCDRNKKITACLVDGERGKIIATREING